MVRIILAINRGKLWCPGCTDMLPLQCIGKMRYTHADLDDFMKFGKFDMDSFIDMLRKAIQPQLCHKG